MLTCTEEEWVSAQKHWRCTNCGAETYHAGRPLQRLVSVAASQDCVSRDALGGPFCHMQAGVITPEVGGADMQRGGVG